MRSKTTQNDGVMRQCLNYEVESTNSMRISLVASHAN